MARPSPLRVLRFAAHFGASLKHISLTGTHSVGRSSSRQRTRALSPTSLRWHSGIEPKGLLFVQISATNAV